VGFVRKAAQDLSELVGDLLDLAKVEAGKVVVRPSIFEVADLFGALRGMLRPLLAGEAVGLVFEEPEGLPSLRTDEAKVSQILRNFISNALKFTPRGGSVTVGCEEGAGMVRFVVADTGRGIPEGQRDAIFQPFVQVEKGLTRSADGSGLGLAIARELAERMGGTLTVTSEVGAGSRFVLSLPRATEDRASRVIDSVPGEG
jgi:signal transduction histidine kinase